MKTVSHLIPENLSNLSISMYEFVEIKNVIDYFNKSGKKSKEMVLVFDDFERTKINIIELLGVINEFCENRSIKIIIVADEKRINDDSSEGNNGHKYLEFKEKVIQTTLNLTPNYSYIVKSIVNNYHETCSGYKDFLVKNNNMLYKVFCESNSNNLRTLK